MKIGDKIRTMRTLKGFSQEVTAEKLDISPNAYGRIERNETDLNFSRLQQVSKVLDIGTPDLLSFGEQISNHFSGTGNKGIGILFGNSYGNAFLEQELEKANLKIKTLEKECELKDALIEALKKNSI